MLCWKVIIHVYIVARQEANFWLLKIGGAAGEVGTDIDTDKMPLV